MSRSITISLRVKPEHLAKALDGLEQYDKSWITESLASIVRQTFFHGINYLSVALPIEASKKNLSVIAAMTKQPMRQRRAISDPSDLLRAERITITQDEAIQAALDRERMTETPDERATFNLDGFDPSELINKETE